MSADSVSVPTVPSRAASSAATSSPGCWRRNSTKAKRSSRWWTSAPMAKSWSAIASGCCALRRRPARRSRARAFRWGCARPPARSRKSASPTASFDATCSGNVAPRGICGSGLVDAVAAALDLGWINATGRLANGNSIALAPPVDAHARRHPRVAAGQGRDRRRPAHSVQQWGASVDDLSRIYLAGAFGNYINRASARRIGLLDFPPEKVLPAGQHRAARRQARLVQSARARRFLCRTPPQNPACAVERRRAVPGHLRRGDALSGNGRRLIFSEVSQRPAVGADVRRLILVFAEEFGAWIDRSDLKMRSRDLL